MRSLRPSHADQAGSSCASAKKKARRRRKSEARKKARGSARRIPARQMSFGRRALPGWAAILPDDGTPPAFVISVIALVAGGQLSSAPRARPGTPRPGTTLRPWTLSAELSPSPGFGPSARGVSVGASSPRLRSTARQAANLAGRKGPKPGRTVISSRLATWSAPAVGASRASRKRKGPGQAVGPRRDSHSRSPGLVRSRIFPS